jgi:hypothetical protein
MRRSRTLLALAVGMAVAALATAVARSPGSDPPSEAPAPPAASRGAARPQAMELRAGARAPRRIATRVGRRVLLRVEVPQPGEVELPTLGLTESATPAAAPTFDVLLERAGEHRVVFRPVSGPSQPVGTLVVRPS